MRMEYEGTIDDRLEAHWRRARGPFWILRVCYVLLCSYFWYIGTSYLWYIPEIAASDIAKVIASSVAFVIALAVRLFLDPLCWLRMQLL